MERRMDSGEAMRDGTMAEGGSKHAKRPLHASEQFCTRSCARCGGLLVSEWYYDLNNTGEHSVETLRCVQCGHRVAVSGMLIAHSGHAFVLAVSGAGFA